MKPNILKRIFFDEHGHWDKFVRKNKGRIRANVLKEVVKFRDCGNPKNGFKLLVCEGCHDLRLVPYRCKGRFCTTCSCGETEEWSRLQEEEVCQVNHHHVIMIIDEGIREIFLKNRYLLKEFMDETVRIVKEYFDKNPPGIIAGLHTFDSKLKLQL